VQPTAGGGCEDFPITVSGAAGTRFERSSRRAAIVRAYLVAENQMCSVAAFADAFETIDGMTVILRRQAKKRS
jgi:hypothetical protein